MPLIKGYSKKSISKNIKTEMRSGKSETSNSDSLVSSKESKKEKKIMAKYQGRTVKLNKPFEHQTKEKNLQFM